MRHCLELIGYKAYAELRAEAARAYLGFLWWIVEPVLYMAVFYVVFGVLFQRGGEGFAPFLLCGLVVWKWFDSTVRSGANAISSNAHLMRQVYLPKFVFPSIVVLVNTVKFLVVMGLLVLFLQVYGLPIFTSWLALPLLFATQMLLIAAVTLLAAAVVPFLPDLKLLIDNGLTLLFFLSGVFFGLDTIPEGLQPYFSLNPMATLIDGYRKVLLHGLWPDWHSLATVALGSLLGIWLAQRLLIRFDRSYPKVLML